MARYKTKETLLNIGYQSMGVDDENLELFVKHILDEDGSRIMYCFVQNNKTVGEYSKTISLEDILFYNRMKEFLKL